MEKRWKGGGDLLPWRMKFLSCCIVDILGDDVTGLVVRGVRSNYAFPA